MVVALVFPYNLNLNQKTKIYAANAFYSCWASHLYSAFLVSPCTVTDMGTNTISVEKSLKQQQKKAQQPQKPEWEDREDRLVGWGGQTDRDDVKREPLTPPNVESATEMGMIHDITPSNFSPNVWEKY